MTGIPESIDFDSQTTVQEVDLTVISIYDQDAEIRLDYDRINSEYLKDLTFENGKEIVAPDSEKEKRATTEVEQTPRLGLARKVREGCPSMDNSTGDRGEAEKLSVQDTPRAHSCSLCLSLTGTICRTGGVRLPRTR